MNMKVFLKINFFFYMYILTFHLLEKLKGMNETTETMSFKDLSNNLPLITQRVLDCAYLTPIIVDYDNGKFKFAGKTMTDDVIVLFSVDINKDTEKAKCTVQSENTVIIFCFFFLIIF